MDTISFEDFSKLNIRIGTITKVVPVEDADRLLKLTVDFGDEKRTIVAGIAEHLNEPQQIVGTQVPCVVNLEPKELRGVTSEGMMLGVGGDTFTLLSPRKSVPNGAQVR